MQSITHMFTSTRPPVAATFPAQTVVRTGLKSRFEQRRYSVLHLVCRFMVISFAWVFCLASCGVDHMSSAFPLTLGVHIVALVCKCSGISKSGCSRFRPSDRCQCREASSLDVSSSSSEGKARRRQTWTGPFHVGPVLRSLGCICIPARSVGSRRACGAFCRGWLSSWRNACWLRELMQCTPCWCWGWC